MIGVGVLLDTFLVRTVTVPPWRIGRAGKLVALTAEQAAVGAAVSNNHA